MGFKEEKAELRRKLRRSDKPTPEASLAACRAVLAMPEYQAAKTVFCFVGAGAEFDTTLILEDALAAGKTLAVPLCVGRSLMEARRITGLNQLISQSSWGIREPAGLAPLVHPEEIDFAVVPCLACDKRGFRLGHGGGFYDRYLENTHFSSVLLCRADRVLDRLPADSWDVSIRLVATENGLVRL